MRKTLRPLILAALLALPFHPTCAQTDDPVAPFRAQRKAIVEDFRVRGVLDWNALASGAQSLEAIVREARGETHTQALLELGKYQNVSFQNQKAIETLTQAAKEAEGLGLRNLAFDAWIDVARVRNGAKDHGGAVEALEYAQDAAGEHPTEKQRADIAGYLARLELDRGEIELGIVDALAAIQLTPDLKERFYSELNLADGLTKLVWRCNYRPIRDDKSSDEGVGDYGACRRAVAAAQSAYDRAEATAALLGWTMFASMTRSSKSLLELWRDKLLKYIASSPFEKAPKDSRLLHPLSQSDVVIDRDFSGGLMSSLELGTFASQLESSAAQMEAVFGRPTADSLYLRGEAQEARNAPADVIVKLYVEAAALLESERSNFFDPRRQGAPTESNINIVDNLAHRLLALGRKSEAFATFESSRARGLGEFALAMTDPDISADDRRWIADLLLIEARSSEIEGKIVREIVANGHLEAAANKLQAWADIRAARRDKLKANEPARARFDQRIAAPLATLEALRTAAASANAPVLLYWQTTSSLIAWYVGPDDVDVGSVFLLPRELKQKVDALLNSAGDGRGETPYDETTARELYLFLLGPFADRLKSQSIKEIVVVPGGALFGLPFEALIDPATGAFVNDRWAVSYAPNATMALAALQRPARPVRSVAALVDGQISRVTGEMEKVQASGVEVKPVGRSELFAGGWRADGLHILTHGEFNASEALLSRLEKTTFADPPILAAELVALPLRGLRLATLSACKGGQIDTRISGEIYGFSWALLAGGAEATVLSRWDVNSESNGRWMGDFYSEVGKGVSVSEAAATAARKMRASGVTHPYYWAAMQASGR